MSKVWFITGCSSGFGRELAKVAAEHGDKVVGTLRKEEQMQAFEELAPGSLKAVLLDVTRREQIDKGVADALQEFGKIDVLVNNAGYGSMGAIEAVDPQEMRQQFEVNVFGSVEMIQAVLPSMRERKEGRIINITSIAGLRGSAGLGIYNGSKFALEGIGEALARELSPFDIKVTNVEPGPFRTDWAGRSATYSETEIPGYEASAGKFTEGLKEVSGNQVGDPHRAAQAMYKLAYLDHPPLHLPMGGLAYRGVKAKVKELLAEVDKFEYLGLPTDFPEE